MNRPALVTPPGRYATDIRRAAPPEFLRPDDFVALFGYPTTEAARRAIVRGDFGPFVRVGRRVIVRRESLSAHLAARESSFVADSLLARAH